MTSKGRRSTSYAILLPMNAEFHVYRRNMLYLWNETVRKLTLLLFSFYPLKF